MFLFFLSFIAVLESADGTQSCLLCHHPEMIYGIDAMIYNGGLLVIVFYPIYVISFVLIFREFYKMKCDTIKKYILSLITGSISFVFSLLLVLCGIIMFHFSVWSAFEVVCFYHPFILLCNIVSFIYLIRSLYIYLKENKTN